jgi:two-component system chemotaxis response regulator CheY
MVARFEIKGQGAPAEAGSGSLDSAGALLADCTGVTSNRRDSIIGRTPYAGHAMVTPSPGTIPVILVADDSPDIRALLTMLLEDEGYSIVEATDGQDALELALDRDVDLILLDVAMPRLTGTAFCLAYRNHGGDAPVILITAANDEAVAAATEACGAVGHISKPFNIEHVLQMVERYVGGPLGRTA